MLLNSLFFIVNLRGGKIYEWQEVHSNGLGGNSSYQARYHKIEGDGYDDPVL